MFVNCDGSKTFFRVVLRINLVFFVSVSNFKTGVLHPCNVLNLPFYTPVPNVGAFLLPVTRGKQERRFKLEKQGNYKRQQLVKLIIVEEFIPL